MKTVDQMIDDIIRREGGYVDHPADKGGPTKYGITQETLSAKWGFPASAQSVQSMSEDLARQIYREEYFEKPNIDQLPPALQPFMFDAAVNHGPSRAVKCLQYALRGLGYGRYIDGVIGPQTRNDAIRAIAKHGEREVLYQMAHELRDHCGIIARDPSQHVFLVGWHDRIREFEPNPEVPDEWKARALRAEGMLRALTEDAVKAQRYLDALPA